MKHDDEFYLAGDGDGTQSLLLETVEEGSTGSDDTGDYPHDDFDPVRSEIPSWTDAEFIMDRITYSDTEAAEDKAVFDRYYIYNGDNGVNLLTGYRAFICPGCLGKHKDAFGILKHVPMFEGGVEDNIEEEHEEAFKAPFRCCIEDCDNECGMEDFFELKAGCMH